MRSVPEGHQWRVQDVGFPGRPLNHAQRHHPIKPEGGEGIAVAFTAADWDENRIPPLRSEFLSNLSPPKLLDVQ